MHYLFITVYTVACLRLGAQARPYSDNTIDGGDEPHSSTIAEKEIHKVVFSIPSKLEQGFTITVKGKDFSNKTWLTFSLVTENKEENSPDFKNVACQLMADFVEDTVTLKDVVNGIETRKTDDKATDLFYGTNFTVVFRIEKEKSIGFNVGESTTQKTCDLKHKMEDIMYLTIGGDVEKVEELHFLLA